jgi:AraC-like DNA-binding protein
MKTLPRELLVHHNDRVLRERLRTFAKQHGYRLRLIDGWDELLEGLRTVPSSALTVVDPDGGGGSRELSIELPALLNRFPSATVVAALHAVPGRLEHVRRLGEWGVAQVIDLEEETTTLAMGLRLLGTRGRPLRNLIQSELPANMSGLARSILAVAGSVVSDGGQGAELARAFHITTRTLSRWCRRAQLPPPRQLLAWMRILIAAELLDDSGRTVSDVALACGYSADAALRQALRSFINFTPTALREQGAFRTVSRGFLQALADARSPRRRYRNQRQSREAV